MRAYVLLVFTSILFIASGCQINIFTKSEHGPSSEEPAGGSTDKPNIEDILLENDAFQIVSPKPNESVIRSFTVQGKARVFEAAFQYRLEDGHNVLAEGYVTASEGAPAWGDFEFHVTYTGATSPYGVLIIFAASAKDGSPEHELYIPLQLEDYE